VDRTVFNDGAILDLIRDASAEELGIFEDAERLPVA